MEGEEEEQTGTARWESDDEQGGPPVGDGGVPAEWASGAWDRAGWGS